MKKSKRKPGQESIECKIEGLGFDDWGAVSVFGNDGRNKQEFWCKMTSKEANEMWFLSLLVLFRLRPFTFLFRSLLLILLNK